MYAIIARVDAHHDHTVKRVHWFRSSALRARWKEEVRLLAEEMTRCVRFFAFYRQTWNARALVHDMVGKRADAAYSRKYATFTAVTGGQTDDSAQTIISLCTAPTHLSDSLPEDEIRHSAYDLDVARMTC